MALPSLTQFIEGVAPTQHFVSWTQALLTYLLARVLTYVRTYFVSWTQARSRKLGCTIQRTLGESVSGHLGT